MKLKENKFLTALRAGRQQVGIWVSLSSPYAAEAVAPAGYDWALLDMEHCPNDLNPMNAIAGLKRETARNFFKKRT